MEAVYSGRFVNFLFNCERQRQPHRERGADAWGCVMAHATPFLNLHYSPVPTVLKLDPHMRSMSLWHAMWLARNRAPLFSRVVMVRDHYYLAP